MSNKRVVCPYCERSVGVNLNGNVRRHGSRAMCGQCQGSGQPSACMEDALSYGREYRVAYVMADGEWDVVDRFMAVDDDAANAYAEEHYDGDEWYVLDPTGRNINGGRNQS